jgi:hypothetical protein
MPTKLPPEHHIARHASWNKLRKDDTDPEKVIGVLGAAFKMRPVDTYLSTTSLEYFAGERQQQIASVVRAMRASRLDVKTKSGFAIGNVGKIAAVAAARNYTLRILHEPEDDNKAHVAVRRFPPDDMELFELLAADAWSEVILNSDKAIPAGAQPAPDEPAWTLAADDAPST